VSEAQFYPDLPADREVNWFSFRRLSEDVAVLQAMPDLLRLKMIPCWRKAPHSSTIADFPSRRDEIDQSPLTDPSNLNSGKSAWGAFESAHPESRIALLPFGHFDLTYQRAHDGGDAGFSESEVDILALLRGGGEARREHEFDHGNHLGKR
jgi:hypothetical protein